MVITLTNICNTEIIEVGCMQKQAHWNGCIAWVHGKIYDWIVSVYLASCMIQGGSVVHFCMWPFVMAVLCRDI